VNKSIEYTRLRTFIQQVYQVIGVPEGDAFIAADSLVFADMRGIRSHGIERLGTYIKRIQQNLINPAGEITVLHETDSTLQVDANNLLGPVACVKALAIAKKKAVQSGSATLSMRNSNHYGAAAFYTDRLAQEGFLAFTCTGATADVAPWGSYQAYLGTNPVSVSVPSKTGTINLDMATSVQAKGKVRVLHARGEALPEGWCLDKNGNPTTNTADALEGTMLPMAGPKGYGMALFVDILGGVLSGALFGKYAPHFVNDFTQTSRIGHFFYLLNIENLMPKQEFLNRLDVMVQDIKSLPVREGFEEILLPGEIEARKAEEAMRTGIVLDDVAQKRLLEFSASFSVPLDL
jgi:LDH2 family malate/lactate/ureidoglycolate dehydrogenase